MSSKPAAARPRPAMPASVPQLDLKRQDAELKAEIRAALERVLHSAAYILGEEVEQFEREFAAAVGARHCVAVNSGTSALHLALLAAGVGPGDEVVTTPNSFIATAESISYTGATPVFADVTRATGNLDPEAVERAITPRTRALLPVHLYGRPADLSTLVEIAGRRGLALIEDACQAHGALYGGRPVGSFGLAGAFSFYPTKNLAACGEGGAVVTNDDRVAELVRSLRSHGERRRYDHDAVGFNYRMEAFQGAVLRVKLKRLRPWTARRQEIAARYRELLAGAAVEIPADDPACECVYHQFAVYVEDRDRVRAAMAAQGISTAIYYPVPLHLQAAYANLGHAEGSFLVAERACRTVLCLPIFPELTDAEVDRVAGALREALEASASGS